MASAGVLEQHPCPLRLDSESQLLFKLSRESKISELGKSSLEKMMFRKGSSASAGECGSQTAAPARGVPGDAPRSSPERDGSSVPEKGSAVMTPHVNTEQLPDCNSNVRRVSNQNTGARGSYSADSKTAVIAVASAPFANAHNGPRSHYKNRQVPSRRRASLGNHRGRQRSPDGDTGGIHLERLTQGRTGVVRLARTEPPRREAWSIFAEKRDPRLKTESGEGHRFISKAVARDWCDVCSHQITAEARQCQNCSYTCHLKCEGQVRLDCNQRDKRPEETPPPRGHCCRAPPHKRNEAKEEEVGGAETLSEEEARVKIEEYNAQVSENGMSLAADGSYTGFIKVHLRLSRPVTLLDVEGAGSGTGPSPPIDHEESSHKRPAPAAASWEGPEVATPPTPPPTDKRISFYLPSDSVKQLHIGSTTTATEVIQGLLKKFMVLDNPRKFALYRQTHRDGQDLFQKVPLGERPLLLRLVAGPDPDKLTFVLKENETNEVEWHAFSVPELQNFLVILVKEETERVRCVEQRYAAYRQKLEQALRQHSPDP